MVQYLRLHTDADGESHFSEEAFTLNVMGDRGDGDVLGSSVGPASHYARGCSQKTPQGQGTE